MSDYKHAPLQDPSAQYVAISKAIFGEGAERFAYRFYEIAADAQTIVGSPLVAKESRHVLEHGGENRKDFVKQFCRTQQSARRIAEEFNSKLDSIKLVDERTPRVDVLDCSIYYLKDKNLGELATLVEPRLDHNKWHKWNANNGVRTEWHHSLCTLHKVFYPLIAFLHLTVLSMLREWSQRQNLVKLP